MSGERDRVAIDHPLQAGHAGAEVSAQPREGGVDDGDVEQDEEHPDAHDDERERAASAGHASTVGR
jgi:hypothetical protein